MRRGRCGRLAGLHLRRGQEGGPPPRAYHPNPSPGTSGFGLTSQDACTATRGRRRAARPGDPRAGSPVPERRGAGGSGPAPRGLRGLRGPRGARNFPRRRRPPPPPRRGASVRLGFLFLCLAAPRARPPRRRRPLTILQMEAMFRTVMSLKVAAIPHRHLYKVKTGLSMVAARAEAGGGGGEAARVRRSARRGEGGGRREGAGGGRGRGRRRGGRGVAEPGARAAARARTGGAARARRQLPAPGPGSPRRPAPAPGPGPGPGRAFPLISRITMLGPRCGVRPSPARLRRPRRGFPRADPSAAGTQGQRPRAAGGAGGGRPGAPSRGGAAGPRGRFPTSLLLFCLRVPNSAGPSYFGEWRRQGVGVT